jgi:Transcription elongation factor
LPRRDATALLDRAARDRANSAAPATASEVWFGASVTIRRDDGREQTFRIVGEDEADPAKGSISHVSPLAKSMFGKRVGDTSRPAAGKPKSRRSAMGLALPRASNQPNPAEKVMMPDYPRPPFAS